MIKIKHELTARIPSLKFISVVGMGGIGKTTLARSIYEDRGISYHFHVLAWVTISQEYELRNVLYRLLRSIGLLPSEIPELGDEYSYAEMLYKCLKERRYLIVLDDIWSTKTWNELKPIFPDDNKGSRVIFTTRLAQVAEIPDHDTLHSLECLNIDESWTLLCEKLFVGKHYCPPDLVEIGMEIAKGCQGLPLAIVVVAGHLSKIDMNQDCWANVAKGLASILTRNQEQLLDLLCLSYNHLPQHMKACFLYMGVFPKNSEILITKVIRLWCAAGFLNAEEKAEEKCMEELISRNLITVKKKNYDCTAKICGIHDLLWDLCLRQARREGQCIFGSSNFRIVSSQSTSPEYLIGRLTSSYLYFDISAYQSSCYLNSDNFGLLKILDIHLLCFENFPDEVLQMVSLRYLELATCANIPPSISNLCNLETLINKYKWAGPILPKEIWLLKRLRHVHIGTCTFLPNRTSDSISILPDLQTLSTISFSSCTMQVFSSIPNLKQLKIHEMGDDRHLFRCLNNLSSLSQLEELTVNFSMDIAGIRQQQTLFRDAFPQGIKKLTLKGSNLPWEDMDILAMLPNLVVLKLKKNAFKGPVFEQTVEGFPRLKFLLFQELDLKHWVADDTIDHFPVLQHLILKSCYFLEEIPCCIGEISTLESIELSACSASANDSARTIQREQRSMGNYDLRVLIDKKVR